MDIDRYRLTASHNIYGEHHIDEDNDPEGEWVKYADVVAAMMAEPAAWQRYSERLGWTAVDANYAQYLAANGEKVRPLYPATLASVPAPSGAPDQAMLARARDWMADNIREADIEGATVLGYLALYLQGSAPQAVPAEDVVGKRLRVGDYPIGTKAYSSIGGYWTRVAAGWQAMGGDVFPRYGGDAIEIELPVTAAETARYVAATNYLDLVKYKERLEAEATSLRRWLGELLAVIHRDGGHYQDFAGAEQAVVDAQSAVVLLFQAQDERNDLRRKLEEAERERDDAAKKREEEDSATSEFLDLINNQVEAVGKAKAAIIDALTARAEAAERKLEEHRRALIEARAYIKRGYVSGAGAAVIEQIDACLGESE